MPTKQEKKQILEHLQKTYCRLRPSPLEGVGVFAIQDIPANTDPFPGVSEHEWHQFSPAELENLDPAVKKMITDFYCAEKDGSISIPECALNGMDISFFLNTSPQPNVRAVKDGLGFLTTRLIKKGEELTVSYATYDYRYRKK